VSPETSGRSTNDYLVDRLLRTTTSRPEQEKAAIRAEIGAVIANGIAQGRLPPADRTYLAQVVAARTGVTQAEAERQVDQTYADCMQAVDTARKAVAHSMYWTFLSLLVGAFSASLAATIGGRQRDRVVPS
jgi:hypothetical protein